jgi:uncharacterized hydrophobic protein (TIGR00271 family)
MREAVFFEGPDVGAKLSRFWILLTLASVIASAGVGGDSTATVIGAMIVAPLMTPILGTMLAVILADRANLGRCVLLVATGALAAIAIGFLVGLAIPGDVVADTNAQVAARVTPRLIDLLAALATGVVGSVALVRSDISDTLPGVAIAISLVPPLTVVGLTLEAGETGQATGALLLFATNVMAILVTGIGVMALYGVHKAAEAERPAGVRAVNRRRAITVIAASLALIAIPLSATSTRIATDRSRESDVRAAATAWADSVGWRVVAVQTRNAGVLIQFEGPEPIPDTAALRESLVASGVNPHEVEADLVPVKHLRFG